MGIVVGENTVTEAPPERRSGRTVGIALTATSLVLVAAVLVLSGDDQSIEVTPQGLLESVELGDSGRWVQGDRIEIPSFDVVAAGDRYVLVTTDGDVVLVDGDGGTMTTSITAAEFVRGVVAGDDRIVAWGNDLIGPAIWTSQTGTSWQVDRMGFSVLGVAIQGERTVAVGLGVPGLLIDPGQWVSAEKDGAGAEWLYDAMDAPGTAIISTGTEFLTRGRIAGGDSGFLSSPTGTRWEELGPLVIHGTGQAAEVVKSDDALSLRIVGDDRLVTPPEWPVISSWLHGDRIWVHTPSAVWSTSDGAGWHEYPVDRTHGIPGGTTTILPFDDRILALVAPNPNSPRTIYTWYLGG